MLCRRTAIGLTVLLFAGAACDQVTMVQLPEAPEPPGDVVLGAAAFEADCANCHASRDGFDLAFFGFADTTIVRRAVAHVDTATALDIVAYIRSLEVLGPGRDARPFQPGGELVGGDLDFALRLFGEDAWPAELTVDALLAIDPLDTPVAVPFPVWSVEQDNVDWMPDTPMQDGVLGHHGGWTALTLDRYYASGRPEDLLIAVQALRHSERDPDNPDAPCVMDPIERFVPDVCFETRRWIASLGAQYMLRERVTSPFHRAVHDSWWDVGNAVRRSLQRDHLMDNGVENWATWMWLGWSFEPSRHASVYLSLALVRQGLERHAVFHTLRSLVARPGGSVAAYDDVRNAARFAPAHWTYHATVFGYEALIARLASGLRPPPDRVADAVEAVEAAQFFASRKVSADQALALAALEQQVLDLLD